MATVVSNAKPAAEPLARSRAIVLDPRVLLVGGGVAFVGVAVLAAFLWMVPTAAARELRAACRGLRAEVQLNKALCPSGAACQAPVLAPDFTAKDLTGKDVKLSDYRGKVVLVNFWASWCGVCKTEKPGLTAMASDMASDDFVVLALTSDHAWPAPLSAVLESLAPTAVPRSTPASPQATPPSPQATPPATPQGALSMDAVSAAYRQALPNGTPFKLLLDPPDGDDNIGRIATSWGIKAVPESALIDRRGNLRAYFVNKRDWSSSVARTCLRSVIDGE